MIDIEKTIQWFENRKGKVSYSMQNRNGLYSYDCSSSIYYALRSGGAKSNGWTIDTEREHSWLLQNGFEKITRTMFLGMLKEVIFLFGEEREIVVEVLVIREFLLMKIELSTVIILQMEFLWITTIDCG